MTEYFSNFKGSEIIRTNNGSIIIEGISFASIENIHSANSFVVHKNLILIEDLDVGWEKAIMDIKNYLTHKAILLQGDFWSKPTSDQLMDNNELYLDGFNKEDIVALYKSKKDVQQGFYAFLMVVVVVLVLVYIFKK